MEKSSRVLHHGNPKNKIFYPNKFEIDKIDFYPYLEKSPWLRRYQSYISNCYINGKVFARTTPWKPIFSKKFEIEF